MSGLLGGNIKGDVVVTVQLEPQSLIMLAVLIVAVTIIIIFLQKTMK
jgi:hypothetical protein